ncbi:type VI secretion system lipoprotein TssJ [Rhodobacter sp. SY28-1]|uniref:type VI secretion system lipoprotein TssJ n=1 Tax=Rhodobacter sp. SY28-1 TaxID=2562317 RepID=UPI0010BF76A8|nr:type VI secretion system lipoprotein TssJ [Rhodobacter sp. SY28-1]
MTHEFPRRAFLIGSSAALLVACAPAGPGSVTIVAQGAAGMNPGPDGADRPLTLQVLQLRGAGAFDGADFFGLQNASATLGGDLVKADAITLAPGGKATKTVALEATTALIAIVAGYRDPAGKQFRAKSSVSPTDTVTFALDVTASGIKLTPM